jgi:hypothetical protein
LINEIKQHFSDCDKEVLNNAEAVEQLFGLNQNGKPSGDWRLGFIALFRVSPVLTQLGSLYENHGSWTFPCLVDTFRD